MDTECQTLLRLRKSFFVKRNISWKKYFRLICADKIYKTVRRNLLRINGSRDIKSSDNFTVPEIVFDNKILDKMQTRKDPENSTHCLGD